MTTDPTRIDDEAAQPVPRTRRTDFAQVGQVTLGLLKRTPELLVPWILIAAFELVCLITARSCIGAVAHWYKDIDNLSAAVITLLIELPVLAVLAVVMVAAMSLAASARYTFWSALGEVVFTGRSRKLLHGLSLTRGLLVAGMFATLELAVLGVGCFGGFASGATILLVVLLVAGIMVAFLSAPYFAARHHNVGRGMALSLEALRRNPAIVAATAVVLALTWWLPDWLILTHGHILLTLIGHAEVSTKTALLASECVAGVAGYFGWVFAGAAFACMDADYDVRARSRRDGSAAMERRNGV